MTYLNTENLVPFSNPKASQISPAAFINSVMEKNIRGEREANVAWKLFILTEINRPEYKTKKPIYKIPIISRHRNHSELGSLGLQLKNE